MAEAELVLLLGDLHIPMKQPQIPELFSEILVPGMFSNVICTGNIGPAPEVQDYLKSLGKTFHLVKGEYEDAASQTPDSKTISAGKLKISAVHGHQIIPWGDAESLSNYMREQDTDIIVSGHTHDPKCEKYDGRLIINPGSFTGAYGPLKMEVEPGFVVLEIREKSVEVYFYRIAKKEVVVSKVSWTKGEKMK